MSASLAIRLAPAGETMFPPRAPFFRSRLGTRAAEIAACAEENEQRELAVRVGGTSRFPRTPSPGPLRGRALRASPAHRPKSGR